jgi:hypothetical protein
LRIYTYYIPIWICILLSFIIYVAVGYHVFHQRNQLRNMTFSQTASGQDGKPVSRSENNDLDLAEKVRYDTSLFLGVSTDMSPSNSGLLDMTGKSPLPPRSR